jgi:hypothetical protein
MKVSHLALAFAAIMLSTAPTFAQNSGKNSGASDYSPGHQMQNDGGSSARGASEYSPGHEMKNDQNPSEGPGASEYSPGHQAKDKTDNSGSTGSSTGTRGNR